MKVANGARAVEVAEIRITAQLLSPILLRPSLATSYVLVSKKAEIKAPRSSEDRHPSRHIRDRRGARRHSDSGRDEGRCLRRHLKLDLNGFTASCHAEMATIDETGLISLQLPRRRAGDHRGDPAGREATYTINHFKRGANEGEETLANPCSGRASSALRRRPWPILWGATRARASRRRRDGRERRRGEHLLRAQQLQAELRSPNGGSYVPPVLGVHGQTVDPITLYPPTSGSHLRQDRPFTTATAGG